MLLHCRLRLLLAQMTAAETSPRRVPTEGKQIGMRPCMSGTATNPSAIAPVVQGHSCCKGRMAVIRFFSMEYRLPPLKLMVIITPNVPVIHYPFGMTLKILTLLRWIALSRPGLTFLRQMPISNISNSMGASIMFCLPVHAKRETLALKNGTKFRKNIGGPASFFLFL